MVLKALMFELPYAPISDNHFPLLPPFGIIQFPLLTTKDKNGITFYTHCRRVIKWVAPKMDFTKLEMAGEWRTVGWGKW